MSPALLSYLVPPTDPRTRVTMCSSALVAAVLQHQSLRAGFYAGAGMTLADESMMVVYAVIVFGRRERGGEGVRE